MPNEIISVVRVPVEVERFEVALYDGTNAEWIVETFFDSFRPYIVDPSTQDLTCYLRNNTYCYIPLGAYAKRAVVPEVQFHGVVSEEQLKSNDSSLFIDPNDYPGPLDAVMS